MAPGKGHTLRMASLTLTYIKVIINKAAGTTSRYDKGEYIGIMRSTGKITLHRLTFPCCIPINQPDYIINKKAIKPSWPHT